MSPRISYVLSGVAAVVAAGLAVVLYVETGKLAAERDGAVRALADEHNRAGRLQTDLSQLKLDSETQKVVLVRGKEAAEADRDGWRSRAEKSEREVVEAKEREATTARQSEADLKAAMGKLGALRNVADEAQAALKKAREELEATQAKLGAAESENSGLRERAEAGRQAAERASGELAAARAEIHDRDEEIHKLQGRLGESAGH